MVEKKKVEALFKAVEAGMGPVEILVNNAGITRDNLLMRMKCEEWARIFRQCRLQLLNARQMLEWMVPAGQRIRAGL